MPRFVVPVEVICDAVDEDEASQIVQKAIDAGVNDVGEILCVDVYEDEICEWDGTVDDEDDE